LWGRRGDSGGVKGAVVDGAMKRTAPIDKEDFPSNYNNVTITIKSTREMEGAFIQLSI